MTTEQIRREFVIIEREVQRKISGFLIDDNIGKLRMRNSDRVTNKTL